MKKPGFNISRYRKRIHKEFEVEVLTPMFLGGANVNEAQLRTPSLKGMLRFWWRATIGISDLALLREKESALFGDTSHKSPFSVHIENRDNTNPILKNLPKGQTFPVPGENFRPGIIDYLAYGLRDHREGYTRQHYPVGTKFIVKFTFGDEEHEPKIIKAFRSLVHFGGLGARSRNGFGSLAINDGSKPSINLSGKMKSHSAVSDHSECFITRKTNYKRWEDAFSAIGMAYKDARLALEPKHRYKERILIAKPIVQSGGNQKERHAKPYFLHVGKTPSGYYGQILFMPYRYMDGQNSYSEEKLRQYQEACKKMNRVIKEKLAGGAQ